MKKAIMFALLVTLAGCGQSAPAQADDTIGELNGFTVYRIYDRSNNIVCYSFAQREHLTCVYLPPKESK